jgi:hypothetical protein
LLFCQILKPKPFFVVHKCNDFHWTFVVINKYVVHTKLFKIWFVSLTYVVIVNKIVIENFYRYCNLTIKEYHNWIEINYFPKNLSFTSFTPLDNVKANIRTNENKIEFFILIFLAICSLSKEFEMTEKKNMIQLCILIYESQWLKCCEELWFEFVQQR